MEIALVTGANRGIGFEICRQLAERDINVILTSRAEKNGEVAQEKLSSRGLDVTSHQLDVSDPVSIKRLVSFVSDEYGRLDILVNNAGVYIDDHSSVLQIDMDAFQTTMTTNLHGPLQLCQAFVPMMKEHRYGRIVNISSGMGQITEMGSGYPAYRISKVGLNALTRILAAELQGTDILINSMCPSWVRTDMGGANATRSVAQGADTAIWLATLPKGGPQGGFFRDRKPIPW